MANIELTKPQIKTEGGYKALIIGTDSVVDSDGKLLNAVLTEVKEGINEAKQAVSDDVYAKDEVYTKEEVNNKVSEAITDLVGAAPEDLDTIHELAAVVKDNKTLVNTVNNAITSKVDKSEFEDYKTSNDEAVSTINNTLSGHTSLIDLANNALENHKDNTTVHITADERTAWNAKVSQTELSNEVTALNTAISNVAAVANSKTRIVTSATEPTDLSEGDIWFQIIEI